MNSTAQVTKKYPTYKDFDINKLMPTKFEYKVANTKLNGQDVAINYFEMIPQYNKGNETKVTALYLEGPVMTSENGIQTSTKFGKEESIFVSLDQNDPDIKLFISHMDAIHNFIFATVQKNRKELMKVLKNPDISLNQVKSPIHRPRNENLEIDYTRNPSFFLKLVKYEDNPAKGFKAWQTSFDIPTPNGPQRVDWKLLRDAKITFVPLIRFRRIYISNTTITYQSDLSSAVVIAVEPCAPKIRQGLTIDELCRANPNLPSSVAMQIANMRKASPVNPNGEEDNESGQGEEKNNNIIEGDNGPTFPTPGNPELSDDTESFVNTAPKNLSNFMQGAVPKAKVHIK
jgi:hypothetical protein